nr:tol-pal system-associated acyl-CoA thioesterase [Rubellimicrobium aerolatum]
MPPPDDAPLPGGAVHLLPVRVYYEDTDLAGVVYYANYLRFIERGRTEWARAAGIDQGRLRAEAGTVFAVRRVEADYLAPARFDDLLEVATGVEAASGARVTLWQEVRRGGRALFRARVVLVAMDEGGRPRRIPLALRGLGAGGAG